MIIHSFGITKYEFETLFGYTWESMIECIEAMRIETE